MQLPFFTRLAQGQRILLAGCGGGYDIASALPLYLHVRAQGKEAVLGNLSFTELALTGCEQVTPGCYRVDDRPSTLPYFPERFVRDWLIERGEPAPDVYAFDIGLGVQSLRQVFQWLREHHHIDTVVLCDGGTDSLMFGDERGVGTIVEDSLSILAAAGAGFERSFLSAIGFGVEMNHGLDHYACLNNVATLTQAGAYLGAMSLLPEMDEGAAFLELTRYLNSRGTARRSIVVNSIFSAMQGKYGDHHTLERTQGSVQFINPLMPLYWFFELPAVAERITFASEVEGSHTMDEFFKAYKRHRAMNARRKGPRELPI